MKRRLVYSVFLLCVLQSSLLANQNQQDYEQIEYAVIPIDQIAQKAVCDSHEVARGLPIFTHPVTRFPNPYITTNYAGYVAADNLDNPTAGSVTAVSGRWIVPIIVPSDIPNDDFSFWVGIDGIGSSTIEQIGFGYTKIDVPTYYAWYELFPAPPVKIIGFPVNPGDVIEASVVYAGSDVFTMTITNITQNVTYTVPSSEATLPGAERKSAEWIVEPLGLVIGELPLADFVIGHLWECTATINGVTGPINDPSWQNVPAYMEALTGEQKAIPSVLLQNEAFFVTWKHE